MNNGWNTHEDVIRSNENKTEKKPLKTCWAQQIGTNSVEQISVVNVFIALISRKQNEQIVIAYVSCRIPFSAI